MITKLYTTKVPNPIGPYSQGVKYKNYIAISGQIPIDPITGKIPDNIIDQTKLVLQHIKAIIESSKLKISSIVKMTVYVTDLNNIKNINSIYEDFFKKNGSEFPARSCVEVSRLPKDVKIEIDATAIK